MSTSNEVKELLTAGAHFGHKVSRWHPKMAPYIHTKRAGTHIIDLAKTLEHLRQAEKFVDETAAKGKQILLVGSKRQAKQIVIDAAAKTGMPYVSERWLGGMLTNRNTLGKRIQYLKDQEAKMQSGELAAKYSKLEVQKFQEEIDQMNHLYGGVKDLNGLPGALFITDMLHEVNAVREARKLNVPIVAIVDTNADPSLVDYPIPANDDAIKTLELITGRIEKAILTGKSKVKKAEPQAKKPEAAKVVRSGE